MAHAPMLHRSRLKMGVAEHQPCWFLEGTLSLTCVFLAVMFRLYDSDENGLLDQAVSFHFNKALGKVGVQWQWWKHPDTPVPSLQELRVWLRDADHEQSLCLLFPKSQPVEHRLQCSFFQTQKPGTTQYQDREIFSIFIKCNFPIYRLPLKFSAGTQGSRMGYQRSNKTGQEEKRRLLASFLSTQA